MVKRCCRRPRPPADDVGRRRRRLSSPSTTVRRFLAEPLILLTGVGVNLFKSKLRRSTAVVAGAFLGLVGVVAFAAPASAHHSIVSGTPRCDSTTGEWVVTWAVDTVSPPEEASKY